MSHFIESVKRSSGVVPTLFDIREIWRINRSRCGGRFNLLFFWMYPAFAVFIAPYTILCILLVAFRSSDSDAF